MTIRGAETVGYYVPTDWRLGFRMPAADFVDGIVEGRQPQQDVHAATRMLQVALAITSRDGPGGGGAGVDGVSGVGAGRSRVAALTPALSLEGRGSERSLAPEGEGQGEGALGARDARSTLARVPLPLPSEMAPTDLGILLAKIAVSAGFVLGVTAAVERLGPRLGPSSRPLLSSRSSR